MSKQEITIESLRAIGWKGRCPRLKTLAKFINENLPGYHAEMEQWWGSFDRTSAHCRYITTPGKLRESKQLVVYKGSGRMIRDRVLIHNPLEAYRENRDVVRWILDTYDKIKSENPHEN